MMRFWCAFDAFLMRFWCVLLISWCNIVQKWQPFVNKLPTNMSHLCIACASANSCGCNRRRSNNTKHKVHKGMHNERSQNAVPLIRPRRRSPNAVCHSHNNSTPHGKCSPRGSHFQCFCNIAVQFDAHMPSIVCQNVVAKIVKNVIHLSPLF